MCEREYIVGWLGCFLPIQNDETLHIHSLVLFLLVIRNVFLQFFQIFFSGSNCTPFYLGTALKFLSPSFSFTGWSPIMFVERREQIGKRCLAVLFKIYNAHLSKFFRKIYPWIFKAESVWLFYFCLSSCYADRRAFLLTFL